MRKKKGFTLIELIIVVAIFGILILIAVPAWTTYLQRAKIRTQNAKAKAIFNAAQTAVTDLEFQERKYKNMITDPSTSITDATRTNAKAYIYTPEDKDEIWYFYWDGNSGYRVDVNGNALKYDGANATTLAQTDIVLGNSIKKIVDDQMVYKFAVKDYKVIAVACSSSRNDTYIGIHPTTLFEYEKANPSADINNIRKKLVVGIKVEDFKL